MKSLLYLILLVFFGSFISCKKNMNAPVDNIFRFSEKMSVDGLERTYTLNLPDYYYKAVDFSLIIAMHGGGGSAGQFESTSGLTDKANAAKFIVVYPAGVQSTAILKARTWNAGACWDSEINIY